MKPKRPSPIVPAPTNITFGLEASTNLANWLTLTNYTNLAFSSIHYTDAPCAGLPGAFLSHGVESVRKAGPADRGATECSPCQPRLTGDCEPYRKMRRRMGRHAFTDAAP